MIWLMKAVEQQHMTPIPGIFTAFSIGRSRSTELTGSSFSLNPSMGPAQGCDREGPHPKIQTVLRWCG
ncbi:MAG: hypothetical protein ACE5NA_12445, partial [Nitrospiraceae bacterium]